MHKKPWGDLCGHARALRGCDRQILEDDNSKPPFRVAGCGRFPAQAQHTLTPTTQLSSLTRLSTAGCTTPHTHKHTHAQATTRLACGRSTHTHRGQGEVITSVDHTSINTATQSTMDHMSYVASPSRGSPPRKAPYTDIDATGIALDTLGKTAQVSALFDSERPLDTHTRNTHTHTHTHTHTCLCGDRIVRPSRNF